MNKIIDMIKEKFFKTKSPTSKIVHYSAYHIHQDPDMGNIGPFILTGRIHIKHLQGTFAYSLNDTVSCMTRVIEQIALYNPIDIREVERISYYSLSREIGALYE